MSGTTPKLALVTTVDADNARTALTTFWNANTAVLDEAVLLTAAQTLANKTLAGPLLSGTVTLTGSPQRITGDFSATTPNVNSSRAAFQSSVANGQTALNVVPNGTSTLGRLYLFGGSDADNASLLQLTQNAATSIIDANKAGSGTQGALQLRNGGTTLLQLHASGGLSLLDTSDPGAGQVRVAGGLGVTGIVEGSSGFRTGNVPLAIVMAAGLVGAAVPASVSNFACPFVQNISATENQRQVLMPRAGTARRLYLVTLGAQPAGGALVATVRKNGVNTSVAVTVAGGAAAGTFSDLANAVAFAAGDLLSIGLANANTGASAPLGNVALAYDL